MFNLLKLKPLPISVKIGRSWARNDESTLVVKEVERWTGEMGFYDTQGHFTKKLNLY